MLNNAIYDRLQFTVVVASLCICHCCDGLRIKACCTCLFLLNAVTAAAAAATAAAADVVVVVAAAVAVAAEFGERPRL